ncbi:hypothetical protein ACQ859_25730 [Roseateles chitinivorans]|uniref:hypothetical protein n=1 Tax=Roseateles chitinivorans TaxID=2917965 RepID=UPI003D66D722
MADPQFCLLAIDHWAMCMTKAEWSGWVQAIGSIAAIAAGSIGIAWQVQRQSRLATDLERRNAESLTARALVDHLSGIEGAVC